MDTQELAAKLLVLLRQYYPKAVEERYKIELDPDKQGWELLESCARRRGFLISGGELDTERMANILLDEFRGGKLGRISLERPD